LAVVVQAETLRVLLHIQTALILFLALLLQLVVDTVETLHFQQQNLVLVAALAVAVAVQILAARRVAVALEQADKVLMVRLVLY
jgi:hypothetical protein